jgi:hypothetical protein
MINFVFLCENNFNIDSFSPWFLPRGKRSPENMETLSKKEKRSESKKRKAKAFLQLAKEIEEVINFSPYPTNHHHIYTILGRL